MTRPTILHRLACRLRRPRPATTHPTPPGAAIGDDDLRLAMVRWPPQVFAELAFDCPTTGRRKVCPVDLNADLPLRDLPAALRQELDLQHDIHGATALSVTFHIRN